MRKVLCLSAIVLFFISCAEIKPEQFAEDKSLYEYALKLYNKKQYSESIPFFESLRNRFPQSPYAVDSELKVADAQYENRNFEEAEISYQTFRSLHPTHPKTPYVVYRLAMTHFERIPKGIDRDQNHTQKALDLLTELNFRWPESAEAKEGEPKIEKCRRALAKREMYVVDFYLKHKEFKAALVRLRPLSENTTFADLQMEAKYKMGFSYYKLNEHQQAKAALADVVQNPEAGKYRDEAKELLQKIEPM